MKHSQLQTDGNSLRARAEALLHGKPVSTPGIPVADVEVLVHELNVQQMELEIQNAELRQSHLALAVSRDRYSDLYEFAPLAYVTLDMEGRIHEANLSAATLLGVERKRLVGANISTWLDRKTQDDFYRHRRKVFGSDVRQTCEITIRKVDGSLISAHVESIAFGTDEQRHCQTALIDVTSVKEARQQLERSEHRYRRLTNALTDCIYRVRVEDGQAVEMIYSANCEAMTGHTPAEFRANPALWHAVLPAEDRAIVERQAKAVLSGEHAQPVEHRIRRKNEEIRWVRNTVSPELGEDGQVVAYDGLLSDITDRVRAEQETRQHEETLAHVTRLNTMGEMATGLAHELNQPLAAIGTYALAATTRLRGAAETPLTDELLAMLEKIGAQSFRAGEILHRIRRLTSKCSLENSLFDVNDCVRSVVSLMDPEVNLSGVTIRLELNEDLPQVVGDSIQIEQVLLNLIRNSVEAMGNADCGYRELYVQSLITDEHIFVSIADTGPGIAADALDQVFEPFFSTKSDGMGMGLSISRTIVKSHGGELSVTPNRDRGVSFRLTLPIPGEQ